MLRIHMIRRRRENGRQRTADRNLHEIGAKPGGTGNRRYKMKLSQRQRVKTFKNRCHAFIQSVPLATRGCPLLADSSQCDDRCLNTIYLPGRRRPSEAAYDEGRDALLPMLC